MWRTYHLLGLIGVSRAGLLAGCDGVPTIEKKTVGKMGLKGVPGLNLVTSDGGSRHNQGVCLHSSHGLLLH